MVACSLKVPAQCNRLHSKSNEMHYNAFITPRPFNSSVCICIVQDTVVCHTMSQHGPA